MIISRPKCMDSHTLVCDRQTHCAPVHGLREIRVESFMTFQHISPEMLIMIATVRSAGSSLNLWAVSGENSV